MLICWLSTIGLVLCLGSLPNEAVCNTAPPKVNGLVLPIPYQTIPISGIDSLYAPNGYKLFDLWLDISNTGEVSNVRLTEVLSESKARLIRKLFSSVRFTPCVKSDTAVDCRIPVRLLVGADSSDSFVSMPLGPDSCVEDVYLYAKAVRSVGLQPPELKRFPWFHATFPEHDSLNILPYALIGLKVGVRGEIRERSLVSSNFENYARQVLNATTWGKYRPAKWNDRAISSTGFLLISFFPTLSYPTVPYPAKKPDSLSYHSRLMVRFLADTAGLITVPIPREAAPGNFHIPAPPEFQAKTLTIRCFIDSCGISRMTNGSSESQAAKLFLKSLSSQIRFYPAMDVAGHCRSFNGIAKVTIDTEAIVRIEYLWLP
jgi:hypothetical protein